MTPNAARLKQICETNPNLPVLFISDEVNGGSFVFGTYEELLDELDDHSDAN